MHIFEERIKPDQAAPEGFQTRFFILLAGEAAAKLSHSAHGFV